LEALAVGVPIVARDLPVLREVFGRAARFGTDAPDFARQMHHAAAQPDPSRRAAGQALAASLTWQAAAHQHLKLYRSLAP
jgi:glycosyltransferase involved in cell wall biosynthesis